MPQRAAERCDVSHRTVAGLKDAAGNTFSGKRRIRIPKK
jgi:hypothetical protein